MNDLYAFLNPILLEEEEVIVSDRFIKRDKEGKPIVDENGNYILQPFKIRALTQEENASLDKKSRKVKKINGKSHEYLDSQEFSQRMIVASTVFPDFSDSKLCEKFGVMDPLLVPGKMLLAGEYNKLLKAITKISRFGIDDLNEMEEEAKNL